MHSSQWTMPTFNWRQEKSHTETEVCSGSTSLLLRLPGWMRDSLSEMGSELDCSPPLRRLPSPSWPTLGESFKPLPLSWGGLSMSKFCRLLGLGVQLPECLSSSADPSESWFLFPSAMLMTVVRASNCMIKLEIYLKQAKSLITRSAYMLVQHCTDSLEQKSDIHIASLLL